MSPTYTTALCLTAGQAAQLRAGAFETSRPAVESVLTDLTALLYHRAKDGHADLTVRIPPELVGEVADRLGMLRYRVTTVHVDFRPRTSGVMQIRWPEAVERLEGSRPVLVPQPPPSPPRTEEVSWWTYWWRYRHVPHIRPRFDQG